MRADVCGDIECVLFVFVATSKYCAQLRWQKRMLSAARLQTNNVCGMRVVELRTVKAAIVLALVYINACIGKSEIGRHC